MTDTFPFWQALVEMPTGSLSMAEQFWKPGFMLGTEAPAAKQGFCLE